ncbi:MAG: RidA family protein [Gemmatimonadetes bacterium]|nr:RidA family protein [Gemmatimonadota bacterium]
MGGTTGREEKTEIAAPVGSPAGSSPAVRVGRMIYTAGQVALDAEGSIVGEGDLHAQTVKAFANLAAVLQAARARPSDVVRLTIYVVNYKPQDLAMIREAGAAFLPRSDAPALTVLGVQSLYREGLLISIEATALAGAPGVGAGRDRAEPR